MDPQWKIKKNEWDRESVSALAFFESVRIRFACTDLLEQFPILLEYHVHADIRQRLGRSGLRTSRGEFHIRTICQYLENSDNGVFVIERHLPPDMAEDRAVLMKAFDALWDAGYKEGQ